eukprot:403355805
MSNFGNSMRQLDFNTTASDVCKTGCIDLGRNFCPSNQSAGVCCDILSKSCPRTDICSNDVAVTYLKQWSCPSESYCGIAYIAPNKDQSVTNLTFSQPTAASTGFTVNKQCKYLISFPEGSGQNDNIVLIPTVITNVEIIFMTGIQYTNDVTRLSMQVSRTYVATFPNKIFLLVRSNTNAQIGKFAINMQYIDNQGQDIDQSILDGLNNISINGNVDSGKVLDDYYKSLNGTKTSSSESKSLSTQSIIIIACLCGGFLVLIGVGIFLIIYCKKKADQVEVLSKPGTPGQITQTLQNGPTQGPQSKANFASQDDFKKVWESKQFQDQLKAHFGTTEVTPEMIKEFMQQEGQTLGGNAANSMIMMRSATNGPRQEGHDQHLSSINMDTVRDPQNANSYQKLLNQNSQKAVAAGDRNQTNNKFGINSGHQLTSYEENSVVTKNVSHNSPDYLTNKTHHNKDLSQSYLNDNSYRDMNQQPQNFYMQPQQLVLHDPTDELLNDNMNQEKLKKKKSIKTKKNQVTNHQESVNSGGGLNTFNNDSTVPSMQFNMINNNPGITPAQQIEQIQRKKTQKQDSVFNGGNVGYGIVDTSMQSSQQNNNSSGIGQANSYVQQPSGLVDYGKQMSKQQKSSLENSMRSSTQKFGVSNPNNNSGISQDQQQQPMNFYNMNSGVGNQIKNSGGNALMSTIEQEHNNNIPKVKRNNNKNNNNANIGSNNPDEDIDFF